ncbi:MAG: N-acyl homoserine lactonase family protein [Eubacteriales bacterium]|nr:N-acyl homoserine lactonase family protein [Eubacteriales bacterium]
MEAVLIYHPEIGYILYDTGNDPQWALSYTESIREIYPVTRTVSIEDALQKENLTVEDIDVLILSHLHFDHAGGLKFFSNTKAGRQVIVSEDEYKDAIKEIEKSPERNKGAYIGKLFYQLPGIEFKTISGQAELAEGITLFVQKCHTAGVVGMIVELRDKTVLFTGDTVYLKETYEKELPPGGGINKTQKEFFDNLKVLKKMQKEQKAEMFFGHDYEQAKKWQAFGWVE